MYGIHSLFAATLSNEGTCTGAHLDTLTDELIFSFRSNVMVQVNRQCISNLSAAAGVQWKRAFASQEEGWLIESQMRYT